MLFIKAGNPDGIFSVDNTSGEVRLIKDADRVPADVEEYNLTISAYSGILYIIILSLFVCLFVCFICLFRFVSVRFGSFVCLFETLRQFQHPFGLTGRST